MNFSKKFLRVVSLVLMVLMLTPSIPTFAASFTDVKSTHWAYSYIEKMAKLKYINGYEDGKFQPKGTLTYLETIQLLSKLLSVTDQELITSKQTYNKLMTDLNIPAWAQDAVIKCLYKGVISENELRTASSKDLLRVGTNKRVGRLDISIFMAKAMGLEAEANKKPFVSLTYKDLLSIKSEYHKLIYVLVEAGVLSPDGTGSGYFEPASPLLREQMAKMLSTAYDYLQKNPPVTTPVPTPEVKTEDITGEITKITNLGTNTFISVKTKSNTEATYLVDSNTSIKLDNKATTVASLFVGQSVEVTITKGTSNAVSVYAKTLEEKITGTIKSITPSLNKIVVEFVKDKATKTIDLTVNKDTDITLDGVNSDLYDLSTGDEVNLIIENNIIIDLKATAKSGEVEGIIVDLETDKSSKDTIYYITVENSNKVKTEYELDEDADIFRDGRRADFEDLRVGDEVILELEYGVVVEIDAEMIERDIEGFITAISTRLNSGTEITIKNKDTNKEETYTLSRNANIKLDKVTSSIFNINVGYFVEVVVGGNEIIEIYADSIGAESIVRGKITSLNTRRSEVSLDVTSSDISEFVYGDNITIKTSNDLYVTGSGYNDFSDLEKGLTVYIFGYYDGYSFIANEINVR